MMTHLNRRRFVHWVGSVSLVTAAGCTSPLFRGQSPDLEPVVEEENRSPLVGDLTFPAGLNYIRVDGVGLVTGLNNTGSDPPPSPERDALINEMQTHDALRPQAILASKRTALVLVRAYLPPGVKKGDRIDVEVLTPPRSETTSLSGGWMLETRMREVAVVYNQVRRGDVDVIAGGDVLLDAVFDDTRSDDATALLRGRILGGGVSMTTRKLGLVLRENSASVRASTMIGAAINNRFHHTENGSKVGVAKPMNSNYIELAVPPLYRNNVARYIRVIRSIAVGESAADRALRLQTLERQLNEPTSAATAALQLEAIGRDAIPILKTGLGAPDTEVRFYSAEALAYLNDGDAAAVLGRIAADERAFRWHAFTALSVMEDIRADDALSELLNHSSAEARYGAFRAIQVRNPNDPLVRGEILGDKFAFHVVPSSGEPLIHFARTRRPEIVVFGHEQTIVPPPFLLAGKRIMIKRHSDHELKVIRFEAGEDDQVVTCPNRVDFMIRTIVELGGRYEDVFQAIRAAKLGGYLEARLAVNATAKGGRVYHRGVETGTEEPVKSEYRSSNPVPELFQDRLDMDSSEGSASESSGGSGGTGPLENEKPGFFGKIKGWFAADPVSE